MNRRGFVALMDAVIFTAVLMLALSATIGLGLGESADERDAGAMSPATSATTMGKRMRVRRLTCLAL